MEFVLLMSMAFKSQRAVQLYFVLRHHAKVK